LKKENLLPFGSRKMGNGNFYVKFGTGIIRRSSINHLTLKTAI
jgi:hypothetical protein